MVGGPPHLVLHVASQSGKRDRSAVDLALKQPLEHDLAESAVRAPRQERIQLRKRNKELKSMHAARIPLVRVRVPVLRAYLHQKLKVHILALRCSSNLLLVAATGLQVDTLRVCTGPVSSSRSGGSGRDVGQRTLRTMLKGSCCATRAGKELQKRGGGLSPA